MRRWLPLCFLILLGMQPAVCAAEDEPPLMLSYGLDGLGKGAALGVAVGLLSAGSHFESAEWKNLAIGTGIGALVGMGAGIALSAVDMSYAPDGPRYGYYVLRDMGYGMTLGLLGGGLTGLVVWVAGGQGGDVVRGMEWGVVFGAGIGAVVGVIEAFSQKPKTVRERIFKSQLHLDIGAAPGPGGTVLPTALLRGRF